MSDDLPNVLMPGRYGLEVIDLTMLLEALAEGDDLDTAVENAAFDSYEINEHLPAHLDRLRALNATGDTIAYWDTTERNT